MSFSKRFLAFAAPMILAAGSSSACPARILPSKNFDDYKTIFVGEVVGVELTSYREAMLKGLREDPNYSTWTDTTPPHKVTVLPLRLRKGNANEVEVLTISGCGVPEPETRQNGLFLIESNGKVHVIYDRDSLLYGDYVELVGLYYRDKGVRLQVTRPPASK